MRRALLVAGICVGVLAAYAIGGTLAAFVASAAVFVVTSLTIRGGVVSAPPPFAPAARDDRSRDPRHQFAVLNRIEVDMLSALGSRRLYDHLLRPRLFQLALTLLAQRRPAADAEPQAVRNLVGERVWPLIDPSKRSFAETPKVEASEIRDIIRKLEELT